MIFLQPYKKYFDVEGRATRKEYWSFSLFNILVPYVLSLIDVLLNVYHEKYGIGLISGLFLLGSIIPSTTVGVRRLHDTNRKGWWLLLWFIPIIGWIWLLVLMCFDSQPGENRFGKNLKGVEMLPLEKKALETTALS